MWPGQGISNRRTAKTGHPGQDRRVRTGRLGQDILDRTSGTGQQRQAGLEDWTSRSTSNLDRTART
jgi:hypothetical protein